MDEGQTATCSFCGKSEAAVHALLHHLGKKEYICTECVRSCIMEMNELHLILHVCDFVISKPVDRELVVLLRADDMPRFARYWEPEGWLLLGELRVIPAWGSDRWINLEALLPPRLKQDKEE